MRQFASGVVGLWGRGVVGSCVRGVGSLWGLEGLEASKLFRKPLTNRCILAGCI